MPYNLTTMQSIFLNNKEITLIKHNNKIVYQSEPDYTEPFYVENISNDVETLDIKKVGANAPTLTIEYLDGTTWRTLCTTSTTAYTRTLAPGEKLYLRCDTNEGWGAAGTDNYSNRISGCSKVGGNIMSLLYGSSFTGNETTFKNNTYQTFRSLFDSNTVIKDAKDLLLPATTLVPSCYRSMFGNCTSLTTAPALPATTLANICYRGMFVSCSSLTTAPALPATTMVQGCYQIMFRYCTSLTTAPDLNALVLVSDCYKGMFDGCTILNSVKCLAESNLDSTSPLYIWLQHVADTGTFTKKAGITWPEGGSGIPSNWTVTEV